MAAFDQIRLLHLKKYLICTLLILKRRKYLCWSLFFDKVPGLQLYEKRGVQHRCFPMKFAKLLRTLFLQNIFGCCFWKIYLDRPEKGGYILLAKKYMQLFG